MLKYIRSRLFALIVLLFASFYISFVFTIGYQIFKVHAGLIYDQNIGIINFGVITFIIFAFVPILLWKMVADSDIPLLKDTIGIRFLLSELAIIFTGCLFISKEIYNSIAKSIMELDSQIILDMHGKITLIEVLSLAVPFILFLYLTKKAISHFIKKFEE